MEGHPSKRRRVESEEDQKPGDFRFNKGRERGGSLTDKREKLALPKLVLPAHHAFGVHGASRQKPQHLHEAQEPNQATPTRIQARQLVGTQVSSVAQPAPETASTVLAIAIDNGQGVVSELDVPMASKSVWIQGYGELTMANDGNMPTITASAENKTSTIKSKPGAVTPPPAAAASQARSQALQTQEAIAKQLDVVPQAPSTSAPTSPQATPESSNPSTDQNMASSQSPLAVNTPESHSQQVLSSPPTPVPATPQSSTGSSSSYFSSSPASLLSSSSPQTSSPSTTSPILNPNNSQLPATSNSTLSATTSSSSSIATSLSITSASSEASVTASSLISQSAASEASLSSSESLAALISATRSPSGFTTSTLSSQSLSSGSSSTQITPIHTTLTSSAPTSSSLFASSSTLASSQLSSQSISGSSLSGSPSSTGIGAGGIGNPSNTPSTASPTASSGGGSSGSSTPPASVLAGGIVGGVAGATILLLIIVLLFRWRRGKTAQRRTISPPISQAISPGGVPQAGNMTQRSSITPIVGAGLFSRLRPASAQTATTADTAPSERGFQKISGRKLPSVLASGGDGYGDAAAAGPSTAPMAAGGAGAAGAAAAVNTRGSAPGPSAGPAGSKSKGIAPGQSPFAGLAPALRPASPPHSLSGSSFYRDSHGFYGGLVPESTTQAETDTSSSPSTSPSYPAPLNIIGRSPQDRGGPSNRQPEVAITRPGPARTPVINQPGVVPIRTPSRANQPPLRPARGTPPPPGPFRDGLGRSHPSQDGSRGSRFREDTTPP